MLKAQNRSDKILKDYLSYFYYFLTGLFIFDDYGVTVMNRLKDRPV